MPTTGLGAFMPRTGRIAVSELERPLDEGTVWISFLTQPDHELSNEVANRLWVELAHDDQTRVRIGKINDDVYYGVAAQNNTAYSAINAQIQVANEFPPNSSCSSGTWTPASPTSS